MSNEFPDECESESGGERAAERPPETNILRIIADDYERAQRARVGKGEQIRAIVQGYDTANETTTGYLNNLGFHPVVRDGKVVKTAADVLLERILKGLTESPHPYLSAAYLAAYRSERRAFDAMAGALENHPAWAWMSQVRGVGPTLGAKLLARLDLDSASNRSSFISYCGLATVPGQRWECAKCGWVGLFPVTHNVTGQHKGCAELAVRTNIEDGEKIRAAQPKAHAGEKRSYDAYAKKTMFLLGMSWVKAGAASFYGNVYRKKVDYYNQQRPGWSKGRKHYSALRAAEKFFLSNLYEAWCLAVGREPSATYAETVLGHDPSQIVSAAEVLVWEANAKASAKAAKAESATASAQ